MVGLVRPTDNIAVIIIVYRRHLEDGLSHQGLAASLQKEKKNRIALNRVILCAFAARAILRKRGLFGSVT